MMMDEATDEHDVYVEQLKEVFDSCDTSGTGKLNKDELKELCVRLHLETQADALVGELIQREPTGSGKVSFDEFKDKFILVLAQTVDLDESSDDEDLSIDIPDESGAGDMEISPKYVKGSKKYGRRSRPETDTEGDVTFDWSESEKQSSKADLQKYRRRSHSRSNSIESIDSYEESSGSRNSNRNAKNGASAKRRKSDDDGEADNSGEMYEAEGQLNQSIAEMENALDPVSEEEHLKDIWRELGVGTDGYLTIDELAVVCEHIGMEEMNPEELQHLFDKLDVDTDGRVSFQEFLEGLFQHGGPTAPSTPVRPNSTPRQKLRFQMSLNPEERIVTPSFVSLGPGAFTALDTKNSGFCSPEAVIELWDTLGIPQGADILEYLQFDLDNKINLADLSYALEQEMRSVEDDNATYQAAIASYLLEMKHLKTTSDQRVGERDKLKTDLAEANNRISILVKEGDDRYASLDKTKEKELLSVDLKYQEQIKMLQAEVDKERQTLINQTAKHRQNLESEIEVLKEEEIKLKDKLTKTQKELEKLEHEILEMADKCAELEKQNFRQQRELDSAVDLHRKLEEMETNKDLIVDEQKKFTNQKLQQLEAENKELKDKNDELTMEVEDLKQQAASNRRHGKTPKTGESVSTKRTGSFLSDYTKPDVMRKSFTSDTSADNTDEDENSSSTLGKSRRRRLPQTPSATGSIDEETESALEKLNQEVLIQTQEKEALKEMYEQEMKELKDGFELERKEIEQAFKLEITDIEELYNEEKASMMTIFQTEKEELATEFELKLTTEMQAKEKELDDKFNIGRQDILIRAETEKNLMEQKFAEEQLKLMAKMKEEFAEELQSKLQGQQQLYREKIEEAVAEDQTGLEQAQQQKAELELQIKMLKEELELKFEKEKHTLKEDYNQQKLDMERQMNLQREEQLKNQKEEIERQSKKERKRSEEDFDLEKSELQQQLEIQRDELEEKAERTLYGERAKFDLQMQLQRQALELKADKERQKLMDDFDLQKAEMEQHHRQKIQEYEEMLSQGEGALQGKLKEDFIDMLELQKEEIALEEKTKLLGKFEEEKQELQIQFDSEKGRLANTFSIEKSEMEKRYQLKVADLERQLDYERERKERDQEMLQQNTEHEKDSLSREMDRLRETHEKEIKRLNDTRAKKKKVPTATLR